MRYFLIALLAAAAQAAPARAYYVPRNPHFSSSGQSPQGPEEPRQKKRVKDALGPGRWSPRVRAAINNLIARLGRANPRYDPKHPPAAAVPIEGFCFGSDAALAVFVRMTDEAAFKADDGFWRVIPIAYGRRTIADAYARFSNLPSSIWSEEPEYLTYRNAFVKSYFDQCAGRGHAACREFLDKVFAGFSEPEAEAYASGAIAAARLRPLPEARTLIAALTRAGFEVWALDADPQPSLEAEARACGISSRRVIGIRASSAIPIREGKVADILAVLGRDPDLVIGVSADDLDLMGYGPGLRLLIGGNKFIRELAGKKGWLVQPAFTP
ncbi:MAG: HAD family hydrolase [Elusimicrobiota bacterium]